jgi:hypothetical protein
MTTTNKDIVVVLIRRLVATSPTATWHLAFHRFDVAGARSQGDVAFLQRWGVP